MKLHIQHLQNALQNGNPDALNLAARVSESILEQINNLSVIATEFSDFASIGGKPKESEKSEEIDLTDLLRKVVTLYTNEPGTEINYDIPETPIMVVADRSQLVRIITNLMQNAVQAIPAERKGEIHVSLAQEGNSAVIQVGDNGEGISAEAQAKLFTPYFTTKTSGTGLGLAMTRQMVEVWGGTISYNTTIGEGTTFTIKLPIAGTTR
jgi:signal transduction histidine kinase